MRVEILVEAVVEVATRGQPTSTEPNSSWRQERYKSRSAPVALEWREVEVLPEALVTLDLSPLRAADMGPEGIPEQRIITQPQLVRQAAAATIPWERLEVPRHCQPLERMAAPVAHGVVAAVVVPEPQEAAALQEETGSQP